MNKKILRVIQLIISIITIILAVAFYAKGLEKIWLLVLMGGTAIVSLIALAEKEIE